MKTRQAIGTALLLLLPLTAGACASGPTNMTVHGTELVAVNLLDGESASDAYPDVQSGAQVTVVDSTHKVIATGELSPGDDVPSVLAQDESFKFTVVVPEGLTRYGIEVGNNNRGTVWFTEKEMKKGPGLCLGDGC